MNRVTSHPIRHFLLLLWSAIRELRWHSPQSGEAAPDFELRDQDGELHSIEDYRGQWVALYFYPKDDTPGCTTEACEFRDDILANTVTPVARSSASAWTIRIRTRNSRTSTGCPFPLLADTEGTTADDLWRQIEIPRHHGRQAADVPDRSRKGMSRSTMKNVDPDTHSQEVLERPRPDLQNSGTKGSELTLTPIQCNALIPSSIPAMVSGNILIFHQLTRQS